MNNQIIAAKIVQLAEERRTFRELPASKMLGVTPTAKKAKRGARS